MKTVQEKRLLASLRHDLEEQRDKDRKVLESMGFDPDKIRVAGRRK